MKYKIIEINVVTDIQRYIEIVNGEETYTFWCTNNNEIYDEFLTNNKLTHEEVMAAKTDTWYDFPEGE